MRASAPKGERPERGGKGHRGGSRVVNRPREHGHCFPGGGRVLGVFAAENFHLSAIFGGPGEENWILSPKTETL